MTRTATAHALTVSAVDKRIDDWGGHLARLQTMQSELTTTLESLALQKAATAEDMAQALLPVAESMARLTEETRQTLARIVHQAQQGHTAAIEAVAVSTKAAKDVARDLGTAMLRVEDQVQKLMDAATEEKKNPPTNPWGPAVLAALLPTAAVLWLMWKLNLFR